MGEGQHVAATPATSETDDFETAAHRLVLLLA